MYLKPCPFCNGEARLRYSFKKALIECSNRKCKLQPSTFLYMDTDRVSKLVKAWNTKKYEGEN
ncbi:Lar family restriction alleviation protein [Staphylococcus epidermidis]|uniref:Lar family restriction alleviation protein n=1 Tax=Staphylococcus epidermidis TaxID=1282 RepID=UPI002867E52E|nr:Lar family restriction alleviation protein [Staphylococcus epidermidis]WMW72294.1 Lar family restriction alleviation protein [Staphylococcus epidermidis]